MTQEDYEYRLRTLDFADYSWRAIRALIRYKDDQMIELNQNRLKCDIELVIDTLIELKSEFEM